MIVCIEGLDGVGKTTQCKRLAERLKAFLWKFPYTGTDSPTGKLIYEHLRNERQWDGDAKTDALVFQALQVANRMEVATELLEDASRGNVVLDRYWPSGYAYGGSDGLNTDYLISLHRTLPQPDLFILLDGTPELLKARRPENLDRYERDAEKLSRVASLYRELWFKMGDKFPRRWVLVDANQPSDVVTATIMEAVVSARVENGHG